MMVCALGTVACSHVWQEVSWRPDIDASSGWAQGEDKLGRFYTFQAKNVSVILREPVYTNTVFYGPTPIPIIPAFGRKHIPFYFDIKVNSPTSTTIMDFSKLRIQLSEQMSLQLKKVQCSTGKGFRETIEAFVSKEEKDCHLDFESIPSEVKEVVLDFDSIQTDGESVRLPPIKCLKMVRYQYVPFYFH